MWGFSFGRAGASARRPCLSAFMDETAFPRSERGPVERLEFIWFALTRLEFLPDRARVELVPAIAGDLPAASPSAWGRGRGPHALYHRGARSGRPGNHGKWPSGGREPAVRSGCHE